MITKLPAKIPLGQLIPWELAVPAYTKYMDLDAPGAFPEYECMAFRWIKSTRWSKSEEFHLHPWGRISYYDPQKQFLTIYDITVDKIINLSDVPEMGAIMFTENPLMVHRD